MGENRAVSDVAFKRILKVPAGEVKKLADASDTGGEFKTAASGTSRRMRTNIHDSLGSRLARESYDNRDADKVHEIVALFFE